MREHRNNIGIIRLVLAGSVIIGHAPEQIDGDRHREPLTTLFHTISLGEFAVDGFFLLSGFLITQSVLRSSRAVSFLERRVLRIYPAFIVAFLLSLFLVSMSVGANPLNHLGANLVRLVALRIPESPDGALAGLPYPAINGAMWTIYHEFRCYLLTLLLALAGVLSRRALVLVITAALLALLVASHLSHTVEAAVLLPDRIRALVLVLGVGGADSALRLTTLFLCGTCAYLYRSRVDAFTSWKLTILCFGLTVVSLFFLPIAEAGLGTAGGLTLYWLAFKANLGPLQRVNDKWDISYGTYLYGWPIAITILALNRAIGPAALTLATLPLALLAGAASWWGVERWSKRLVRSRLASGPEVNSSSGFSAMGKPASSPVEETEDEYYDRQW